MDRNDWSITILFIGIFIGIPIGWILAQTLMKISSSSVIFERDQQGRISGIHYVPGVKP
jgi:ABC-type antimicrobial peptide transport system permease subunit